MEIFFLYFTEICIVRYIMDRLHIFLILLVLIGGINWGLIGGLEFNLVSFINEKTFKSVYFLRTVYLLVGFSAILLMLNRDTYLPFLGKTVMPTSLFTPIRMADYNHVQTIKVPDSKYTHVVYWAASPEQGEIGPDPRTAYNDFSNMGVEEIRDKVVNLYIKLPEQYKVPLKGILPRHIHYRFVELNGMISRVHTETIK